MKDVWGLLADDFTGALDAASPFAERGLSVRVRVSPEHRSLPDDDCDVLLFNLDCRNENDETAQQRVKEAKAALAGRPLAFLKIDSTLRGPIRSMIGAALEDGQPALLAPSVFEQGRRVVGGFLEVGGKRLADSSYMTDPLARPHTGPLSELAPGLPVTSPDMNGYADLRKQIRGAPPGALIIGAASAARVLAENFAARPASAPKLKPGLRALAVFGSKSLASRAQAARLQDIAPQARIFAAPAEAADPHVVERQLAAQVRETFKRQCPDLLLLTGGATAMAVLGELGVTVVRAAGEVLSGLPTGRAHIHGKEVWIITKAGGFGDAGLIARFYTSVQLR